METTGQSAETVQPYFSIEKIYVKDLSVEVPLAPSIFLEQTTPEIAIQLNTHAQQVGETLFEAEIKVTVTASVADKTYFLVEACQAGVFQVAHVPPDQLDPLLGIACPNLLFPYARETVTDVVMRAGFPPVILQPVNFESLYVARINEIAEQQAAAKVAEPAPAAATT